ncbi:uncharacterized protein PAE49_023281 isoform 5-T9 [Odontesthes bonariensis]|uniref:uncharacterized protein LOC142370750 isoform X5 n=1 Tax=Odontesthes bonariensis TaxID=219752 RepID=UPI003F58375B
MGSCTATRTPLLCSSNSRVRLHGHCGNMTLCGYKSLLFLFVVLTTIDLSKEGCRDYFQMEHWTKMFKKAKTPNITLYSTKDFKNISECTLSNFCQGKECKDTNMLCCILSDCLPVQGDFSECEKESLGNVSLFNFRCLMAKHKKLEADGCEGFETVCKHYANILLSGSNNLFSKSEEMKSNTLMALLVFSASLNFMLPLAFCLYMHQQRRQDRRQQPYLLLEYADWTDKQSNSFPNHSESISLNPDGSATR